MTDETLPPDPIRAARDEVARPGVRPADTLAPGERAGDLIGRYKLLEQIGEGGMGTVWMAEQKEPVKRRVALKIIKLGMDTKQVVARFEAERQALAMMDHPHIAKVLDAGATAAGRPYFVMEYIKGIPILEYCDHDKVDTKARLELFTSVCHAIQHAHQKGIIHRDIKPTNVLVTMHDGVPVTKVIDFGIAKATNSELTTKTLFTEHRQMIGTPAYMSPEQAEMSGLDIDTRSDIYSLGVLLYELLTGTTPFDIKDLLAKGFAEMMRTIREDEPHKPSARISTLGDTGTRTAQQRRVDPKRLSTLLRGDLDWIVMKCLEKDRTRRYETANGLAADIKRHLANEPVSAGAPSAGYRLRKFRKRNRVQVLASSAVVAALLLGVVGFAWQAREASNQRDQAVAARNAEARQRELAEAKEREANDERAKAVAAAEQERQAKELAKEATEAERVAKLGAEARREEAERNLHFAKKGYELLGSVFAGLDPSKIAESGRPLQDVLRENLETAVKELEGSAVGTPVEVAEMQLTLGTSLLGLGEAKLAVEVFEKARDTFTTERGYDDRSTQSSMEKLAIGYRAAGQHDKARPLFEAVLKLRQANLGPDHPDTLASMGSLAVAYADAGQNDKALPLFEEALELEKAKLGPDHPGTLTSMNNLAESYTLARQFDKAVPLLEETVTRKKAKLGPDHPDTLISMGNLAGAYAETRQFDKALPLYEETLKLEKAKLGPDHPKTLGSINNLASTYWRLEQLDKSVPLFEELLSLQLKQVDRSHPDTQTMVFNLGINYKDAGRVAEGIPLLEEAYRESKRLPGRQDWHIPLLDAYAKAGKSTEAVRLIDEVLADARKTLAEGSPQLAGMMAHFGKTLWDMAVAYADAGQFDEALPLYEETLELEKASLGHDHPKTLAIMHRLAHTYWRRKQLDNSVPLFEELLSLHEKQLGRSDPKTVAGVGNLGVNYVDAGRAAEGIPLLEEAYRNSKKSPLQGYHIPLLGAYAKVGKSAEAMTLIDEVLADTRKTLPKLIPQLLALFGKSLLDMKAYAEAEPLLREGLALCEKTWPDAWPTFHTQSLLGGALLGQKKFAEAEPLLLMGYEGIKQHEKSTNPEERLSLTETLQRLVQLHTAWHAAEPDKGYDAKAAEWRKRLDEHQRAGGR